MTIRVLSGLPGNIKVPPSHNKSTMYLPKRHDWDQGRQYPPAISLSLSSPTLNYGNQSCLGTFNLNIHAFFPSNVIFPNCYFDCFLLLVPFSPLQNPYSPHFTTPDAAPHISQVLPHDFILFVFLLYFEMSFPLDPSG